MARSAAVCAVLGAIALGPSGAGAEQEVARSLVVSATGAPTSASESGLSGSCQLVERGRSHVRRRDGGYLYVEPRFLDIDGDAVTLAGQPTYVWSVDAENRGTLLEDRSFFGAVITGDSVDLLPLPDVEGDLGWVRGVRAGPGHFVFVFEAGDGALHVGDLVAGAWQELRALPEPPSGTVMPLSDGSRLLSTGREGDVVFALPLMDAAGGRRVVFYRRSGPSWTMTSLAPVEALGVDIARRASGGEKMLFRDADYTLGGEGEEIWTQGADGGPPGRLAAVLDDESVRDLSWSGEGLGAQAGWRVVGARGSAAWVVDPARGSEAVLLDAEAARLFPILGERTSGPVWLTHSVSTDGTQSLRAGSLEAFGAEGDLTPFPFVGPLIAAHRSDETILVAGPDAHFDPVAPHVRSLLIDFSLSCP